MTIGRRGRFLHQESFFFLKLLDVTPSVTIKMDEREPDERSGNNPVLI
jgi:hypothetical protein